MIEPLSMTSRRAAVTPEPDDTPSRHDSRMTGLGHLITLLRYELRCAARYRRFTALVLVATKIPVQSLHRILEETLRGSDELLPMNGGVAILMGETDGRGALSAVARYRTVCRDQQDMRFSIVSYPGDVRDAEEMLSIAQRRLREAKSRQEAGSVVSSD